MSRMRTIVAIAIVGAALSSTAAWSGILPAAQIDPGQTSASPDSNGAWRLISDPITPPIFRIPIGVYDSKRDRMLVIEGGNFIFNDAVTVHSLDFASQRWSAISASGTPPNIQFL